MNKTDSVERTYYLAMKLPSAAAGGKQISKTTRMHSVSCVYQLDNGSLVLYSPKMPKYLIFIRT